MASNTSPLRQLVPATLLCLLTAIPVTGASQTDPAPLTDVQKQGAEVFAQSGCKFCHTIGQTGGTKGPDLSAVGDRLSEQQIRKQIMEGGQQMPAFHETLDAKELDHLIAYLRSCRTAKK